MADYWTRAKGFFITGGCASARTKKSAMQKALMEAGIQGVNIISVSSVLDSDAVEVPDYDKASIPHAAFAFAVFAHQEGVKGENIGAGVGAAWMQAKDGTRKAYVVEDEGYKEERVIKSDIMISLVDMADAEKLDIVPKPGAQGEPLLGRREWEKKQKASGKTYNGFDDPEKDYRAYLRQVSDTYFRMMVKGINAISDDFGYAAAALVYVLDTDQVTTRAFK